MVHCVNFRRISAQKNGFLWRVLGMVCGGGGALAPPQRKKGPAANCRAPIFQNQVLRLVLVAQLQIVEAAAEAGWR
jgi:hypothetical protein